MKILLTGGAGFIGSHTYVELLKAGHEAVIVDNFYNASEHVLDRLKTITGQHVCCYNVDVTDAAELDHSAAAAFGAWAQDAVLALDELDILLEPLTDMDPTAATTRAEAAALMYNFMAYSGILTSVETGEAAEAAA